MVIVNDDTVSPIFYYSETNRFDPDANPTARFIFNTLVESVKCARSSGKDLVNPDWAMIRSEASAKRSAGVHSSANAESTIGPLITSQWDQGDPYNRMCPVYDNGTDNLSTYTGCVATAMAQIMRYWRHPAAGQGSVGYLTTSLSIPVIVPDFGNPPFDWSNMPDKITSSSTAAQISAVAQLNYYCGAASYMDYATDGSGAPMLKARMRWCIIFRIPDQAELIYMDDYRVFIGRGDGCALTHRSPVDYAGWSWQGGHSFVLDGMRSESGGYMYHFNFGWNGICDGWYNVDTTGGTGCTSWPMGIQAIINIGMGYKLASSALPSDEAGVIMTTPYATSFTKESRC